MSDAPQGHRLDGRLVELLYDELPEAEARDLRARIAEDPELSARLSAWRRVRAVTSTLPALEPDPQLHYDILRAARLAQARPPSVWALALDWLSRPGLAAAAAMAVVAVLGVGTTMMLRRGLDDGAPVPTGPAVAVTPSAKTVAPRGDAPTTADQPAEQPTRKPAAHAEVPKAPGTRAATPPGAPAPLAAPVEAKPRVGEDKGGLAGLSNSTLDDGLFGLSAGAAAKKKASAAKAGPAKRPAAKKRRSKSRPKRRARRASPRAEARKMASPAEPPRPGPEPIVAMEPEPTPARTGRFAPPPPVVAQTASASDEVALLDEAEAPPRDSDQARRRERGAAAPAAQRPRAPAQVVMGGLTDEDSIDATDEEDSLGLSGEEAAPQTAERRARPSRRARNAGGLDAAVPDSLRRARQARRRGQLRQAVAAYEIFMRDHRGHASFGAALYETAQSYEDLGETSRALQLYRLAAQQGGATGRAAARRVAALERALRPAAAPTNANQAPPPPRE